MSTSVLENLTKSIGVSHPVLARGGFGCRSIAIYVVEYQVRSIHDVQGP
jgi:hypothetical protein